MSGLSYCIFVFLFKREKISSGLCLDIQINTNVLSSLLFRCFSLDWRCAQIWCADQKETGCITEKGVAVVAEDIWLTFSDPYF